MLTFNTVASPKQWRNQLGVVDCHSKKELVYGTETEVPTCLFCTLVLHTTDIGNEWQIFKQFGYSSISQKSVCKMSPLYPNVMQLNLIV